MDADADAEGCSGERERMRLVGGCSGEQGAAAVVDMVNFVLASARVCRVMLRV